MQAKIDTYENRIEISFPLPDGLDALEGGGDITDSAAVWTFARWDNLTGPDGEPTGEKAETDAAVCAKEAYRLLVASSPGNTVKPEVEEPIKTKTVTVTL